MVNHPVRQARRIVTAAQSERLSANGRRARQTAGTRFAGRNPTPAEWAELRRKARAE